MNENIFLTPLITFIASLSLVASDVPQMITFLTLNGQNYQVPANSRFVTESSIIQDWLENNIIDISEDFDTNIIALAQEYYENPQELMSRQGGSIWGRNKDKILEVLEFFDLETTQNVEGPLVVPEVQTIAIATKQKDLTVPISSKFAEESPLIQQALEDESIVDANNFDVSMIGFAINYYNNPEDPTNKTMYEFNKKVIDKIIDYFMQPTEEKITLIAKGGGTYSIPTNSPFITESDVVKMVKERLPEGEKLRTFNLSDFDMNTILNATKFYNNPQAFLAVQQGIKWERYGEQIMELLHYLFLDETERVQKALDSTHAYAIYQMLMHDSQPIELPPYAGQPERYFAEGEIPDTFVDINQLIEYAAEEDRVEELLAQLVESDIKFIDFRPFYNYLNENIVDNSVARINFCFLKTVDGDTYLASKLKKAFPFILFEELNSSRDPNLMIQIVFAGKIFGKYLLSLSLPTSIPLSEIIQISQKTHIVPRKLTEEEMSELRQEAIQFTTLD